MRSNEMRERGVQHTDDRPPGRPGNYIAYGCAKYLWAFSMEPPAHRALATQKKLDYLGFQCLDNPPYSPDLATSDYHLFPGLKKKQLNVAIFRPTRRPGWTDNILNFF